MAFNGLKHSKESKQKMSESHKGLKHSEKTKRKMGLIHKGKIVSKETRIKMSTAKKGEKNHTWKGGRCIRNTDGRSEILNSSHPYSNSKGYVRKSHLIAENALGRYLKPGEEVHHNNKDPSDDRNYNLLICTRSYHTWLHHKMRRETNGI